MIPRLLQRLDQARREFTWTELCQGLLPCATVLRWKSRVRAGEPLIEQAGPKKHVPLDPQALRKKIQELQHGRQRTGGTTALLAELKEEVSRRRFQEMVAEERQNRMKDMKRIYWLKPGAAWSLDTTEYGPEKMKITPLRDLASKYQVPSPLVAPEENGENIALYVDRMFRQEGPPLFLKRDLGSLARIRWDVFGTLTFRSVPPPKRAYGRAWALMRRAAELVQRPYSQLLIGLRAELGEMTGRFHFHFLLGGTKTRNEITLAHQLEHEWFGLFGQGAISKCRPYDRSRAGVAYVTKCLGTWGANEYEVRKFNLADTVTLSRSVFRVIRSLDGWGQTPQRARVGKDGLPMRESPAAQA